jgi:hypothetical protein
MRVSSTASSYSFGKKGSKVEGGGGDDRWCEEPKLAGYGAQPEVGKGSKEPAVGGGSVFVWIGVCRHGVEEWR